MNNAEITELSLTAQLEELVDAKDKAAAFAKAMKKSMFASVKQEVAAQMRARRAHNEVRRVVMDEFEGVEVHEFTINRAKRKVTVETYPNRRLARVSSELSIALRDLAEKTAGTEALDRRAFVRAATLADAICDEETARRKIWELMFEEFGDAAKRATSVFSGTSYEWIVFEYIDARTLDAVAICEGGQK